MPHRHFNFRKIVAIDDLPENSFVDLIGIVEDVGELVEFISNQNKPLKKRVLKIMDSTAKVTFVVITIDF